MEKENGVQPANSTIASRIRIVHLLYAVAFIYSAHEAFGTSGIVLATILSGAWARVYWSQSRTRALPATFLLIFLLGLLYALLAPAFSAARDSATRMQCANNLKQIALAIHNYHDIYKSFPPAYIADDDGRPMHSWRVLILPFMEQQPLYEAYNFDEPWDGPNNRKLLAHMPYAYSCSTQRNRELEPHTYTNYVAVVGDNTAWPGQQARRFNDFVDGTSQSLLVCEFANCQINWMEPTDISYDDAVQLLQSHDTYPYTGHVIRTYFYEWSTGRNVALADASVKYLVEAIDTEDAKRLLTVNDGEPLDFDEIRGELTVHRRLRVDNCIRLSVFVVLVLWPLPWVWINPQGTNRKQPVANCSMVKGDDDE